MNNQHLLVADITELKNSNPAVQYISNGNTYIGIARLIHFWKPNTIIEELAIDFAWRIRVYVFNDGSFGLFKNSLQELTQLTIEKPLVVETGDSLILANESIQKLILSNQFQKVFAIRQAKVNYDKLHKGH